MPVDVAPLIAGAVKAHAAGRLAEAASGCRAVLAADPGNAQANMLLGVLEVKSGRPEEGIRLLERVRRVEPGSFQAPLWLSIANRQLGDAGRALQNAVDAVATSENEPQGQAQLGLCYLDFRMLPEAEAALRKAAELAPAVAEIRLNLSRCLFLQGRRSEASDVLNRVLDRKGLSADVLVGIGKSLLAAEYARGAVECGRRAVTSAPNLAVARILLARALLKENQAAEAELHLRAAIELTPDDADAVAMLGDALRILGRIDEASEMFRRSIDAKPDQGYAYFVLAYNGRVVEKDRPRLEQMAGLVRNSALPEIHQGHLHYGLGKGREDLGEFEEAMAAYDAANRIEHVRKFRGRKFDREAFAAATENTRRQFSDAFFSSRRGVGNPSELPVFVVGMMRSGTTLVEQILSSHPEVGAAGEQTFWMDNRRSATDASGAGPNMSRLPALAEAYLSILGEVAPGNRRVVDKMPNNVSNLGPIHLAFPKARIIHVRRDPVDTCLSIWITPNPAPVEFLHNRDNIVWAYRDYLKIAEHWRSALRRECFLEVDYEELVGDREHVTREMIEFLGLEWDDACMEPERNERVVATPSVWQVRQPVYGSSIRRWKKFEPWLGTFRELL